MTFAWREYALLMRLHKPIGIYLLLWPTAWALWIAGAGRPDWQLVVIFALGVLLMRSAGCVINDFADRHVDPHVARTKERPLASGKVTSKEALGLFVGLCLLAFGLALLLNPLTIMLSFVALGLAALYPFTKRYTHLPQFVLGAAFGWAIPMAFAAQTNSLPALAWWLFAANLAWTVAYDTLYAMVDRDDDVKIGVKSTAILFGTWDKAIIGGLQVTTLAILAWVGVLAALGTLYFVSVAASAGFFVYQQWLIKDRQRDKCFQAFLNNHWFGKVIFLGILAAYLWPMVQAW